MITRGASGVTGRKEQILMKTLSSLSIDEANATPRTSPKPSETTQQTP